MAKSEVVNVTNKEMVIRGVRLRLHIDDGKWLEKRLDEYDDAVTRYRESYQAYDFSTSRQMALRMHQIQDQVHEFLSKRFEYEYLYGHTRSRKDYIDNMLKKWFGRV